MLAMQEPWAQSLVGEVRSHMLGCAEKETMVCYLHFPRGEGMHIKGRHVRVAREKAPGLVRRQKEREKTVVSAGRYRQGRVSRLEIGQFEWFQWTQGHRIVPYCLDPVLE